MYDITPKNIRKNFTQCNHTNQNSSFRLIMVNVTSIFDLISFYYIGLTAKKRMQTAHYDWLTQDLSVVSISGSLRIGKYVRRIKYIQSLVLPVPTKRKIQKQLCENWKSNMIL